MTRFFGLVQKVDNKGHVLTHDDPTNPYKDANWVPKTPDSYRRHKGVRLVSPARIALYEALSAAPEGLTFDQLSKLKFFRRGAALKQAVHEMVFSGFLRQVADTYYVTDKKPPTVKPKATKVPALPKYLGKSARGLMAFIQERNGQEIQALEFAQVPGFENPNKAHQSIWWLKQKGLVEHERGGAYRVTDRGAKILARFKAQEAIQKVEVVSVPTAVVETPQTAPDPATAAPELQLADEIQSLAQSYIWDTSNTYDMSPLKEFVEWLRQR